MKYLLIAIMALMIGCGAPPGNSNARRGPPLIVPPIVVPPLCLDGLEVVWWIELDGSLYFENETGVTHHGQDPPGGYWINETYIVEWYCNVDPAIDLNNYHYKLQFEYIDGWILTDQIMEEPQCSCGE